MGGNILREKVVTPMNSLQLLVERDGKKIDLGSLGKQELRATFELWHNDPRNPATCCCSVIATPLSVYQREGRFYLRAYPHTKQNHDPHCRFFGLPEHMDPDEQYTAAAKRVDAETGIIHLTGLLPVRVKGTGSQNEDEVVLASIRPGSSSKVTQYRRMSALGLLNELWAGGKLNVRSPQAGQSEHWEHAVNRLARWSRSVMYNKTPLSERLAYLGSPDKALQRSWFSPVAELYNDSKMREQRFYVICAISEMGPSQYSYELRLRGTSRRIYCQETLINTFKRRYPLACKAISEDCRFFCLALLSCHWSVTGRHLNCEQGALLPIDRNYMPFDSSYEYRVAHELAAQDRYFMKPLRMDINERWLPDYILLDTTPHTVMEVYGMVDSEKYAAHMEEKNRYYERWKTPLWTWIPQEQKEIPPLPPRALI